uniref:Uncharacterized protein n=1 Tax=Arion vulgaris TaxID=1028688 RepID=A0A0B6Z5K5_9EUPU
MLPYDSSGSRKKERSRETLKGTLPREVKIIITSHIEIEHVVQDESAKDELFEGPL